MIARNAGVAEGTLFRYFATKDELINELYLHLKQSLCQSMIANLDRSLTDAKALTFYIWRSYISWGINHTQGHRAIRQLAVSEKITKETEQKADDMFPELRDLCHRLRYRSLCPMNISLRRCAVFNAGRNDNGICRP